MEVGVFGDKRIVAVIPARGGSKRIPQKNIIHFGGKPMINWTIEAALNSKFIDEVIVSTDCPKIEKVSKDAGAKVPFLRKTAADDISPISEATIACLLQLEEEFEPFDVVVQLMANCPLKSTKTIDESIQEFFDKKRTSQISFFKYGWMNPWWAHKVSSNGRATALFGEAIKTRSQDLDNLYCPTGSVWISNVSVLEKSKTFYSDNYQASIIDWISALDIDDYEDLEMAECILNFKHTS
jgi:CMP-N-acetylneuraminic acid synthetase